MNTVITGPCLVTWNSITFYTEGDVVVSFQRNTRQINTAQHGTVANRHNYSLATVSFTPSGRLAEGTGVLAWWQGREVGQSLVPGGTGNEKALVVTPITDSGGTSKVWTFHRAGPTAMGAIRVGSQNQNWQQLTFTVLESEVTAGSFYSTGNFSAPTLNFDPTQIVTLPARLYYAADQATLASGDLLMDSISGWTITPNLSTVQHVREACGVADITLQNLQFSLTGEAANIYDYQGTLVGEVGWPDFMEFETLKPGMVPVTRSLQLRALNGDAVTHVYTDAGEVLWSLNNAEMTRCELVWGSGQTSNRTRAVEFLSRTKFSTGVQQDRLAYFS